MRKTNWSKLVTLFALLVLCSADSPAGESFDYVVTVGNETLTFVARPELGYVVKARQDTASIAALGGVLKRVGAADISPIRGVGRKGVSVVHSERAAYENEKTIKTLAARSDVQYAAPLFSSNRETVAIIPEIVVRVKPGTEIEQVRTICEAAGCTIRKRMEFTEQEYLIEVLGIDADAVISAAERLNEISFVEWACPNTAARLRLAGQTASTGDRVHAQDPAEGPAGASTTSGVFPNDEYFSEQWHLHNTGQFGYKPDADINAPEAWEITTGDPNIVIAIVDDGVDANHPDLVNNLVPGYDFLDNDELTHAERDNHGNVDSHGTMCAGLAAAEGDNYIGVMGVTWHCKIMPIRIAHTVDGSAEEYDWITNAETATAFRWAAAHGADILSNSWGTHSGGNLNAIVRSAIMDITSPGGIGRNGNGCLVLFSSGNDNDYLDRESRVPEVIGVGATDPNDVRCDYSNYGPELDIVAPSGSMTPPWTRGIWSTDTTGIGGYSDYNTDPNILDYTEGCAGTSTSCPIVAGVAALILSVEPDLTNEEVRHFLERSTKDLGDPGWDEYYGWGRG
jgi:subtilisin family serine protease